MMLNIIKEKEKKHSLHVLLLVYQSSLLTGRLQQMENAVARVLTGFSKRDCFSFCICISVLASFHWLTV